MVMTVMQFFEFDRCTGNTASEIPSFRMCNIRYVWTIYASFGAINVIIINYFCHILYLLGNLLIIRRNKLSVCCFLSFYINFTLSIYSEIFNCHCGKMQNGLQTKK